MKQKKNTRPPKQYQESIELGDRVIPYTLILTTRKSVGIAIRPDMSIIVRAPHSSSRADIADIIRARSPWILRHLQRFAEKPLTEPRHALQYDTHTQRYTYRFLGETLPLHIEPLPTAPSARPTTRLQSGILYLRVKQVQDQSEIHAQLDSWARTQAGVIFARQLLVHFLKFQDRVPKLPTLKIRRMKARWGSCSSTGTITLNQKLIHMDEKLIDYVIVHELCHLIEHNHSKAYYSLLTTMMPDWEARRQQLNAQGMPE